MYLNNLKINIIFSQTSKHIKKYSNGTFVLTSNNNDNNINNKINGSRRKSPEEVVVSALDNFKVTISKDWDNFREHILSNNTFPKVSSANIDGIIMISLSNQNRLDLAKSYLQYLETKNTKPNLATIGRYLNMLYYSHKETLSKTTENEILSICNDIRQNNPILDSKTLEHMALAISLTKDWKKCIDMIEEIKQTANVTALIYSAAIAAAFRHKEESLAWNMLQEILSYGKFPLSVAFLSYLKTLKRQKKRETIIKNLEKLFLYFTQSEIMCQEDVCDDIINTFNLGQKTTVQFSGECEACKTKLQKLELSDEEFEKLRDVFFKNVILGKDVFIKTNPDEVALFQEFVKNMGKFDVVLDGLNIAYSSGMHGGPKVYSNKLATVVSHFKNQNKSVLVLGRQHMKKWPKNNWNFIMQNASVFLTENISQDDPYLIYCTLWSGKNTIMVTRDLMRGHKFLLKEQKLRVLFKRWLSQRQYVLLNTTQQGRVFFQFPPCFSPIAQKNGDIWHIPYIPAERDEGVNEAYHKTFLCLSCK